MANRPHHASVNFWGTPQHRRKAHRGEHYPCETIEEIAHRHQQQEAIARSVGCIWEYYIEAGTTNTDLLRSWGLNLPHTHRGCPAYEMSLEVLDLLNREHGGVV